MIQVIDIFATFNIKYLSQDSKNYEFQIDSILAEIDASLSIYNDSSLISRFNNQDTSIVLDAHFIKVFNCFKTISDSTQGSFDCTLMPLINAWGFGSIESLSLDSSEINSLLNDIGYRKINIKKDSTIYNPYNLKLNFDALAQGYTVDVISAFLDTLNIKNFLVEIGGEVRAKGLNPNGQKWRIGIDKPNQEIDSKNRFQTVINISNKSLATSGSYRKFYIKNGNTYSHTIDPNTGYPVQHNLLSVTVISDQCVIADAYATAFMVMGVKKTQKYLSNHASLEAYLIYNKNGVFETWGTPGFLNMQLN